MAGSGNPYLETWARQPRPFGTPEGLGVEPDMGDAGISPSLRRLMRLAAQVRRQQETLAAGARGQQTISAIDTAPPVSPGFKPYGASPAAANKMEQEQEAARVEQELRAAVEAGSQEAIDALLEMTGPAWDQLRTEKEQFKQYQAYLLSLDKTNPAHAAELEASVAPMQSAWRALQEKEQRLTAWGESANKGISAKAAAGIHDAAESERGLLNAGWKGAKNSWAHVLLPPAVDVLQTLGDWMQRAQRGVAGQLGYMSDALAGREGGVGNFLSNPLPVAIGRALAGDPEILERGRSAGEQWGQTMAPAFAAPAFVTRKTVEAAELATDHLGAGAGGAALLYPTIVDMVAQVEKPEGMSDEEWEATGKAAAREKKYAPAGAKAFFEVLTDPLTYISPGKALSPVLKPLAPTVDKLSKKFRIAGAAKVLREVFLGGAPIEDPDWARWAINAKAAGIDGSVEFYQEAYRAEAALRQKLAALPPELRPKVQDAAPRVLEGVPPAERSGFVEVKRTLRGREAAAMAAALKDIPQEYRALAMDYINTQESKDALLAAMLKDRGISVEFADDILQGYARRRWAPKFQQYVAEHPEIAEEVRQMRLTPLEGRSAKGHTSEEVEKFLREKYKWDGDIWDRNQSGITANDFLLAADAVKRRKDLEEFVKVFGKGEAGEGRLTADEFLKEIGGVGAKGDPIPGLEGKFFSKNDVEQFRKLRHIQDDSLLRKRVIEFNNWVARSLLANPASLTKDLKGQALNAAVTDPTMLRFADEVVPQITGHALPDKDLAELMAAGLATPSFEAEIAPSAIRATKLFGGGKVGRAAGAISESGFIGGALRGVGAGLEAVGLPKAGAAVSGAGKAVGKAGRVLLKTRQETEAAFRLMTYKSAKARGLTRTEALHEVAKYWGDFSQLSKLEKGVLKGFILFFSWQLRALKVGMHQIADHPLRTRLFLSIAAGNVSDDPEFPDWIRRQGGSVIGRDKNGNPRVISLGAGSYLDPWNDIVRGEAMQRLRTDGLGGAVKGVAQGALRRLAPMFQMPIEYATNYDSFSGAQIYLESGQDTNKTRLSDHGPAAAMWLPKPLRDLLGVREVPRKDGNGISYVHVDPEWNWLFNKVAPGVGAMTSPVSAAADPRKELWEAASRALLGTPTYSIREQDLKQQAGNKVRQAREALRKSLDGTGLAMNEQGGLRFDNTSTLGQAMAADNERWKIEARNSGMSEPAYLRLKMGASYPEALRLLDFGVYLNGWDERLKELGGAAGIKLRGVRGDPLEPLKKLSKREQEKDERQRSRALRGLLR